MHRPFRIRSTASFILLMVAREQREGETGRERVEEEGEREMERKRKGLHRGEKERD